MKQSRITVYTLGKGEVDDGTKPIMHSFTVAEAEIVQRYLETGNDVTSPKSLRILKRAAVAFAHASYIKIG